MVKANLGHARRQLRQAQSVADVQNAVGNAQQALDQGRRAGFDRESLRELERDVENLKRDASNRRREIESWERGADAARRMVEVARGQQGDRLSRLSLGIPTTPRPAAAFSGFDAADVRARDAAARDTETRDLLRNKSASPSVNRKLQQLYNAFIEAHDPVTGEMDPEAWMRAVNPDFEGYVDFRGKMPHNINCGLSAQAVALALDGRPRIAEGSERGMTPTQMREWSQVEQTRFGVRVYDIEARLRTMAPGAHAIVGLDYRNGGGHWFNAYWDGQRVWALDGQDGTCKEWPPDYFNVASYDAIFTEAHIMDWGKLVNE